jgi:hypothetical protein
MRTLPIKKYNAEQIVKWSKNCDKARVEGRDLGQMPQLAFYVFEKKYGYVAFEDNFAIWAKSKKDAQKRFEENRS